MDTHVTFVLDSSGSMSAIEEETKSGFNEFLDDQQGQEEGAVTVSLYEFESTVELVYQNRIIENAPRLTDDNYTPGGSTALFDALARAIDETAELINAQARPQKPENVIFVVLTDGKENASEIGEAAIGERVEHRQHNDDWEFLFIGANQDAALTAEEMGIDADHSLDIAYSDQGTREAYRSVSESVTRARSEGETGGFREEDRRRQDTSTDSQGE